MMESISWSDYWAENQHAGCEESLCHGDDGPDPLFYQHIQEAVKSDDIELF